MRLNKLKLEHFKGVDALEIAPNGADVSIYGENGAGKTTIADAYAWLMFGKAFDGGSIEPEIKRRDPATGLVVNDGGIVHAAEAEIVLDGGNVFTIRKEYVEVWTKKRGSAESEYKSDTTNHYINGAPMQKKEYEKKIAEIVPDEVGRLLSMPLYFCDNMKWQDRRKILMEICGEVSDADIIASDSELKPLEQALKDLSIDEYRKSLKAQMKKANDELDTIPARIDELTQMEKAASDQPKETLEVELKSLLAQQEAARKKIASAESGGASAAHMKELAEIEGEQTKLKASIEAEYTRKRGEAESVIRGCDAEKTRLDGEIGRARTKADQLATINKTTDGQAQKLRDEWNEENQRQPHFKIEDTCPTCGQALPQDQIEAAYAKQVAAFNLQKAKKLEEITATGKRMMEQKAKNESEITALEADIEEKQKKIAELDEKKAEAEALIADETMPDVKQSAEWQRLEEKRASVAAQIEALNSERGSAAEIQAARQEVAALESDISARREKLAAIAQTDKMKERKTALVKREKELGEIFNNLEYMLHLSELFLKEKVKHIEESVNAKFSHVRFLLFKPQKNGGLEECCEPTIGGVPVGIGLNKGAEMTAALDILGTLSEHYGVSLPVFIDNCESYTSTSIIKTESQLIRLIVQEGQKKLAVVVEGQKKQEIEAVKPAEIETGKAAA